MARKAATGAQGAAARKRFVAYYRVSTDKQGASGLGLEAQREAVSRHVAAAAGSVVEEFTEVETGTNKRKRPGLIKALAACRLRRATLVIAKLDRLARNVHFVSGLMESGVDFVACDNPHAIPVLLHVLAAFGEHEAKAISTRTRDALAVVKAAIDASGGWVSRRSGKKITRLGNPQLTAGDTYRARKARTVQANEYAAEVRQYIDEAIRAGANTLDKIASALTWRGIRTPNGKEAWTRSQVRRVLQRTGGGAAVIGASGSATSPALATG